MCQLLDPLPIPHFPPCYKILAAPLVSSVFIVYGKSSGLIRARLYGASIYTQESKSDPGRRHYLAVVSVARRGIADGITTQLSWYQTQIARGLETDLYARKPRRAVRRSAAPLRPDYSRLKTVADVCEPSRVST